MGWDRWGVRKLKNSDPEEFILNFEDTTVEHAKPFMQTIGEMSEIELREALTNMGISKGESDTAIQGARENQED